MRKRRKKFLLWESKNPKADKLSEERKRILNINSDFDTVESYKSIRTNLMFSLPKSEKGKVIAVTSSVPGEGKTTTCINLAITFAQTGARVALVDCDLRKARVHRYLEIARMDGVTNVICGYTELEDAIKRNVRENLDCLTAGEIPPNPAELLQTEEFGKMLSQLAETYDYIFIDTPPVSVVTDAVVIMENCAGVVVVARENFTVFDLLDITMDSIRRTRAKMLGVITLGAEKNYKKYGYSRNRKYSYQYKRGYQYKYSYKYGDEPGEGIG